MWVEKIGVFLLFAIETKNCYTLTFRFTFKE